MERDVSYIPNGDPSQRLDLYLPEQPSDKPLPLIVHIHGGGWKGGNKFPCPVTSMVRNGYAVASVEYRFSQKAKFPAQIQDCQAALRWLRANSAKYHLNPEKVGVVGGSPTPKMLLIGSRANQLTPNKPTTTRVIKMIRARGEIRLSIRIPASGGELYERCLSKTCHQGFG
jgi:hypothetical protein